MSSGTDSRTRGYESLVPGCEREALAGNTGVVAREKRLDDRDRLAQCRERPLLVDAETVEPRPLREAEEGATVRDRVEHRGLAGDLVRMQRERVQRSRPEADPLRHASHQQERSDRRLVEQVVVDGQDVDARLLGSAGERLVLVGRLIRADADAELAGYVRSSVTSVRSPILSMRITSALVRVGACDQGVLLEPVLVWEPAHLRRQQREDRLDREEAEVLTVGNPDAARLGDLEVVADLEPADRTPLDPLDGDAQVVQPHLGHGRMALRAPFQAPLQVLL